MGSERLKMPPIPFILKRTDSANSVATVIWHHLLGWPQNCQFNEPYYLFSAYGRELLQRSSCSSVQKCAQSNCGGLHQRKCTKLLIGHMKLPDAAFLKRLAAFSGRTPTARSAVPSRPTRASPWPWGAASAWTWRTWPSSAEAGRKVDGSVSHSFPLTPFLPSFLPASIYRGV